MDELLLVAGFSWLYVLQPDPKVLVSAAQVSYPAPEQAIWCTMHNQTDAS